LHLWSRERNLASAEVGTREEERACHLASGGVFATANQSSTRTVVQRETTLLSHGAER
jgi:hypothetical protein